MRASPPLPSPTNRRPKAPGFESALFELATIVLLLFSLSPVRAYAQGTDTALLRGTVQDESGAVIPGATVTMTNDATKVTDRATTDEMGRYIFNVLKPGSYTAKVEKSSFKTLVRSRISLRVGQQSDLDFTLRVGPTTQVVEVTSAAPLLNTVSAATGTEVTNRYILEMPLLDRDIASLSYLAPGVTQVQNASIGMLGGTVFASNGQRYATAEFRLDGALLSNPEGGEGGTTNVQYKPSVEGIQEFKLINNSFSAEYGNNGGTVVNIVTKSGTNRFHGSGWDFFRRPSLDANDFFANRDCPAPGDPARPPDGCKGVYAHDQYGGSIGGPIKRDRTFFFFDLEKTRDNSPFTTTTTVPTPEQRAGDFSKTFTFDDNGNVVQQQIFNPYTAQFDAASGQWLRQPFSNNVITGNCNKPDPSNPATTISVPCLDPIALQVMQLFPPPTGSGDPVTGFNNYTAKLVEVSPGYHYDIRIDQNFSEKSRITGRYSRGHTKDFVPDPFLAPNLSFFDTHDAGLEHHWTLSPTLLWTNRLSLHRGYFPQNVQPTVDPLSVGFPSILILNPWYEKKAFPDINFTSGNYQGLVVDACCTETLETDTQWMFDSVVTKVYRGHNIRLGGERRVFLNNFIQPGDTSGGFDFGPDITAQSVFTPADFQGNDLASFLVGWGDDGGVGLLPAVANKSAETAFYAQDDWKVTPRLTLNLGLRYEWSTPYSERFDRNQFSVFGGDSGINLPQLCDPGIAATYGTCSWPGGELLGITQLAAPGHRHANTDWNNIAPRLGFAYRLNPDTVVRGGAGIYYGMNFATNWQYGGTAWNKNVAVYFSKDGIRPYASMENPFPVGFVGPQEGKYSKLTLWGFDNFNHGSNDNINAEIYQWNFGIERHLPGDSLIEINYSANRSTHLPMGYTAENRNFIGRAAREKYGSLGLGTQVLNPFQSLFQGPNAIFNEPDSRYNDPTIPFSNLLEPFPQFDGAFAGFPVWGGTSSYHALQVRFEKRASRGLSFTGNYTFSKFIDNSDVGGNAWIGNLGFAGAPQDLTNLRAEKSVSANDTPQRLAFAVIYELPFGRGRRLGNNLNRGLDYVFGGWRVNSFVTLQSGQPITVFESENLLADGHQRPNLVGNPCSGASVDDVVDRKARYLNLSAFSLPGDQIPGSAPRYFSNCRNQGIHSTDTGITKTIHLTESKYLEVRGEFFNFLNTPRFRGPSSAFGSGSFGTINRIARGNGPRHGQIGVRFVF